MNIRLQQTLRDWLDPLAIASYLALGAIWFTSVGDGTDDGIVALLLLTFVAAWLASLTEESWQRPLIHDALLLVLAGSALGVLSFEPLGSAPILLILVATRYAARFEMAGVVLSFLITNAAYTGLLLWRFSIETDDLIGIVVAFSSFQLFAILVMRYARKAERMAESLKQVNADLMATRELLSETARDQERLRLSRELHDVAGHKLTALKLNLRALLQRDGDEASRELQVSSQLANELLDDLRSVVRQLRATDGIDLRASLRRLAEPLPRPTLALEIASDATVPRAEQAEVLLRITQEALTNAARHSQANRLTLRLSRRPGFLDLQIEDDGRARWPLQPGNGLTGMRERIEELGGTFSLAPSASGGVALTVQLPVEDM